VSLLQREIVDVSRHARELGQRLGLLFRRIKSVSERTLNHVSFLHLINVARKALGRTSHE
jgi:hypothetical protein